MGGAASTLFFLGLLAACAAPPPVTPPRPGLLALDDAACREVLQRVPVQRAATVAAARQSLAFLRRVPDGRSFPLFEGTVRVETLRRTVETVADALLQRGGDWAAAVCRSCTLFRPPGRSPVLVTGYYQPVLRARRESDDVFRYPLYGLPPEPERFTRAEIDAGALADAAPVIAWLDDPVELFFLQIQGSGVLELPGGERLQVGYAGSNGRPYTSVGRHLVATGRMEAGRVSMRALKDYLRSRPQERESILHVNERYIFFRTLAQGPVGSLGVPLTPRRSVAADPAVFPPGVPAFLDIRGFPDETADSHGPGLVFVQDSGSAIRGPVRLDLFTGTGDAAGRLAGRMRHEGALYLLLAKER